MSFSINKEIADLRIAFEEYYSTECSIADGALESRKIRKKAVDTFKVAMMEKDGEGAEQVLILLSENTGCAEDVIIFEELIAPLVEAKAITQAQIDLVLNAKALGRWK